MMDFILHIIKHLAYLQDHDTRSWMIANFIDNNFATRHEALNWLDYQSQHTSLTDKDLTILQNIVFTFERN